MVGDKNNNLSKLEASLAPAEAEFGAVAKADQKVINSKHWKFQQTWNISPQPRPVNFVKHDKNCKTCFRMTDGKNKFKSSKTKREYKTSRHHTFESTHLFFSFVVTTLAGLRRNKIWSWWPGQTFFEPKSKFKFKRWQDIWRKDHATFSTYNHRRCGAREAMDSGKPGQLRSQILEKINVYGLQWGHKPKEWIKTKKGCWKMIFCIVDIFLVVKFHFGM